MATCKNLTGHYWFFAVILILFSIVLGKLTIGDPMKIIKDFGLGAISIGGTLIAIFVGIGMVYKEMEKRTIYIILSKPLARWQFLMGKYLGLSLTILVEVAVMTILLFALCFVYEKIMPWSLWTFYPGFKTACQSIRRHCV